MQVLSTQNIHGTAKFFPRQHLQERRSALVRPRLQVVAQVQFHAELPAGAPHARLLSFFRDAWMAVGRSILEEPFLLVSLVTTL